MPAPLDVVILTQARCRFCHDAQVMLGHLAGEYPLRIRTIDIGSPEGEVIAIRGGLLFPPGILLDGTPFCYGRPSEGKLRRGIEHLLQQPHRVPQVPRSADPLTLDRPSLALQDHHMADNPRPNLIGHTPHERHMTELAFAAVALLMTIIAVGGYFYVANHAQYHCPTVIVATGRC